MIDWQKAKKKKIRKFPLFFPLHFCERVAECKLAWKLYIFDWTENYFLFSGFHFHTGSNADDECQAESGLGQHVRTIAILSRLKGSDLMYREFIEQFADKLKFADVFAPFRQQSTDDGECKNCN